MRVGTPWGYAYCAERFSPVVCVSRLATPLAVRACSANATLALFWLSAAAELLAVVLKPNTALRTSGVPDPCPVPSTVRWGAEGAQLAGGGGGRGRCGDAGEGDSEAGRAEEHGSQRHHHDAPAPRVRRVPLPVARP